VSDPTVEFSGPTPQIVVADAQNAIQFYRQAFGADELLRNQDPDGRIMHCELLVLGGRLLIVDDFDADPVSAPARLGGTTVRLHLSVPDVDGVYAQAIAAGATSLAEPNDAFWGDRYAMIRDPSGHVWSFGSGHEDLTIAELQERADAWSQRRDQKKGVHVQEPVRPA
jgi:PhnB protein